MSNSLITSGVNGRVNILGLGSDFDTQKMLELELNILQLKKDPLINQKTTLELEKNVWDVLQNRLKGFENQIEEIRKLSLSNKDINVGQEGYFNAVATNKAFDGSYEVNVKQVAIAHRVSSERIVGEMGIEGLGMINGKEIEVTSDMTIRDLALKINDGDYGISAVVIDNRLVITSQKTGEENEIDFSNSDIFKQIGLISEEGFTLNTLQDARNAVVEINGIEIESQSNSITEIDNIEITLLRETDGPVTLGVERSEDKFIEKVRNFVNGYNQIISTLNELTKEGQVLQTDMVPRQLKTRLGNVMSESFPGNQMLGSIGIEFDRDRGSGFLTLNEGKLAEVFSENPELIIEMFSGEQGVANRYSNIVSEFSSERGLISGRKEGLDDRLKSISDKIREFDTAFERQKESLLLKYAQLEVMLTHLNSQRSYIEAQLGQFQMDSRR